MKETNYKLTLSYVGTNYSGWQVQPGEPTIQGVIEALLLKVFGERVVLRYASRTDAGVHALGQVASFSCGSDFSAEKIQQILNTQLPNDVVVKEVEIVPETFDARRAVKKNLLLPYRRIADKGPFYVAQSLVGPL